MSNPLSIAVVMDPIEQLNPKKDTTLLIIKAAQDRGWYIHYLEMQNLYLKYGVAWGKSRSLEIQDPLLGKYHLGEPKTQPLDQFDIILMRKDPPVDMEYIYATHILEHAETNGTLVINRPQSLRDVNEKIYSTWFSQCMSPTLVAADPELIRSFVEEHGNVVLKTLSGMGGHKIFKSALNDPNFNVIVETLTESGQHYIMVQKFIDEIQQGDKRIILLDGDPIPYALARIPKAGEFRGNLAVGGTGVGVSLNDRDWWICRQIGPTLKEKGLFLVGLDVIGDYLTEINVTSPTCVKEIEAAFNINIVDQILDGMEAKLESIR